MHFSAELEHRVFWIERACQLHDMCKSDWDRIGHISHGIYDEAKRDNWETTDAAVMEVVAIVRTDVHQDCEHNDKLEIDVITERDEGVAECLNDVKDIIANAEEIVNEAKTGKIDIATILKDA